MRRLLIALLLTSATTARMFGGDFSLVGSIQAGRLESPRSWLSGGFGRFDLGGEQRFSHREWLRVGFEHDFGSIQFVANGIASGTPEADGDLDRLGLVELYAERSFAAALGDVRIRAGHFFLPTSRENTEELWTTTDRVSTSAINTWIAHEVRPIGVDLQWSRALFSTVSTTAAGTAFVGNDAAGALLAWRGWTIGDRITTYGETLPLPPLPSLRTAFEEQRRGTQPIGGDLDGRFGYSARVRVSTPQRWNVQLLRYDNRGDRALHHGEYAWRTRFDLLSASVFLPHDVQLSADAMSGDTGMGLISRPHVDARFSSRYISASKLFSQRVALYARRDSFGVADHDGSSGGDDAERGKSWTGGVTVHVGQHARITAEYVTIEGSDDYAANGEAATIDSHSATVEIRLKY